MNMACRCVRRWLATVCATALAACQSVAPFAPQDAPGPRADVASVSHVDGEQSGIGLDPVPACATDTSARLRTGLSVHYRGSDNQDPDLCVLHWSKRSHRLYFGFWSGDSPATITEEERAAFREALRGPVGSEAAFNSRRARLWKRVTVAHVGNPTLSIAKQPRPALELRVVRHDAHGRPRVRAEVHYWIDRATGILLKRQSVTPMANGKLLTTVTWQIDALSPSG